MHDEELDHEAARIVNGRLGGQPVEQRVDLKRIEAAVREILYAVGEDPDREGLKRTPARVARAYAELFAGLRVDPAAVLTTTFAEEHEELVVVRDIEVASFCEHHLLPFTGVAHIGYIPGEHGRITGLSKLARLVEAYARRPQVQERLTSQIADQLMGDLDPRGVIVVVECEHMCMSMRGIRKPGARTLTSAVRGTLRDNAKTRAEAMSLINVSRLLGLQGFPKRLGRGHAVGLAQERVQFGPVTVVVEPGAEPAVLAHVRRCEEATAATAAEQSAAGARRYLEPHRFSVADPVANGKGLPSDAEDRVSTGAGSGGFG
ncbi:MAG TPA: GTP cyclohydrolase I FolE [Stackebrandtia sp.]|nr:GTP cyclohydrolase I FolE [Stackebrandtia sp.]HZE38828.1 GTP cyclohydrolase I FolE [Stackebrandtia sp.]